MKNNRTIQDVLDDLNMNTPNELNILEDGTIVPGRNNSLVPVQRPSQSNTFAPAPASVKLRPTTWGGLRDDEPDKDVAEPIRSNSIEDIEILPDGTVVPAESRRQPQKATRQQPSTGNAVRLRPSTWGN